MGKRIVVALGGNALGNNLPEQMIAVKQTAKAIADLIEGGNEVIIAHGNGPQVGMIQAAMTELTRSNPEKYIPCPLSVCVAMSQGYIGYDLQNALREELLAQNAEHKDWCCTEELMATTKDGKALYLHCLPADINDVSCKDGEVEASVFDRYRTPLYKEASYKPYIIAAMIFLAKTADPAAALKALEDRAQKRKFC